MAKARRLVNGSTPGVARESKGVRLRLLNGLVAEKVTAATAEVLPQLLTAVVAATVELLHTVGLRHNELLRSHELLNVRHNELLRVHGLHERLRVMADERLPLHNHALAHDGLTDNHTLAEREPTVGIRRGNEPQHDDEGE